MQFTVVGCRTYGGYDAKDKTIAQVERVNEQFARALDRAENDLAVLNEAVERNGRLAPFAKEYAKIVWEHARLVESHQVELTHLREGYHGYRATSRLLGGIITDQHSVVNRYRQVVRKIGLDPGTAGAALRAPDTYQQIPPHFLRIQYRAEDTTVGDAISRTR